MEREQEASISESLMEEVFKHPVLYDPKHKEHSNVERKTQEWERVGVQLNLSVAKVKKKWKNLRDSYIKYLRNLNSVEKSNKYLKWHWAVQMEKFKPFVFNTDTYKPRNPKYLTDLSSELEDGKTTSKSVPKVTKVDHPDPMEFLAESEEDTEHDLLENSLKKEVESLTEECSPMKIRRTVEESFVDVEDDVEYEGLRANFAEELDAVDHLMLAYAKTIKQFSLRRQAEAKLQIAQLILRHELEDIQERQEYGNPSRATKH